MPFVHYYNHGAYNVNTHRTGTAPIWLAGSESETGFQPGSDVVSRAVGKGRYGPTNLVTFLERTAAYRRDLRRVEYGDERVPEIRAFLERIAPVNNATTITAPLFVIQSDNDPVVPRAESDQIVSAVQKNGVPIWYFVAKNEGHEFTNKLNNDYRFHVCSSFESSCSTRSCLVPIEPHRYEQEWPLGPIVGHRAADHPDRRSPQMTGVQQWRLIATLVPCLLATVLPLHSQQPVLAIRARAMVDVQRGRLIENATVLVQSGRIIAVGPSVDVSVPPNASVIDLAATTLLPGLIDAHVHLTLRGEPSANARATLLAGFTTVQDLGAAGYTNVSLRNAINAGRIEGPRIVASGPWLGVSGGTCDFNRIGVRGANAFRARIREDVKRGADLVKVCVTGWLADAVGDPARYEISDEELSAALDEAHLLGRRVAVHALSEAGIALSVSRGADLVVHGGFPSLQTVAIMRRRGILQLPTVFSLSTARPEHVSALHDHMRRSVAAGLPIAFGTDAGVIPHGANAKEFEHLATIGLDAPSALRAATLSGARAVGMTHDIGLLAQGRLADIIGVEGNPLEDLRLLQQVSFVMKEGTVFKGGSAARLYVE